MTNAKYTKEAKEAALSGINEDIQNILDTIEKIDSTLPSIIETQLAELKNDIDNLENALKIVPAEYDRMFSRKLNQLIDVATELEIFSKTHQLQLKSDFKNEVKKHANTITEQITIGVENNMDKYFKYNYSVNPLAASGYIILTATLSSLVVCGIMYLVMKQ